MLLHTKGVAHHVKVPLLGSVSRSPLPQNDHTVFLAEDGLPDLWDTRLLGAFTTARSLPRDDYAWPVIYRLPSLDHLNEGDWIVADPRGHVNTLFRPTSSHNSLLVTERCNSNCLMCSQPPKDRDDTEYYYQLYQKLIPKLPKDTNEIGITGGEPTLWGLRFFDLLGTLKDHLPQTDLHVLTNGRSFAWPSFAARMGDLHYQRCMLGIPLYSDVYSVHDHVVQARDAFYQTVRGLHHLARFNQRIEIRVVLHRLTIPRLYRLAEFIYRNLPFVEHVAFMGLENMGYTPYNLKQLWIDPVEYAEELGEALDLLSSRGMNVSIYNTPLCLLPPSLWGYARKSISDWKNIYLDECQRCSVKEQCGGFFASSTKVHSAHLRAL